VVEGSKDSRPTMIDRGGWTVGRGDDVPKKYTRAALLQHKNGASGDGHNLRPDGPIWGGPAVAVLPFAGHAAGQKAARSVPELRRNGPCERGVRAFGARWRGPTVPSRWNRCQIEPFRRSRVLARACEVPRRKGGKGPEGARLFDGLGGIIKGDERSE
jgi:hypothetical protein